MFKKRNLIFICLLILGVFLISGCWLISTPTYTVTFDSQGGSAVDLQTVERGGLVIEPTAPTQTGYAFAGWYKELECTNAWDFNTDTVTANVTLYAKWTINSYTVTYDGNGHTAGTVPVDPSSPYEYGATVTVLNKGDLVKTGYTFDGWNTQADGNGIDQAEGSTFAMGASDVTLYAKWTSQTTYSLRDIGPAGGYIFYDKGEVSDGWRYLEAAPSDESGTYTWSNIIDIEIGTSAQGTEIGKGQTNTTAIIAQPGHIDSAAQLCDALVTNEVGYAVCDDWFLPSKEELNLMYTNLHDIGTPVGGFAGFYYWSSSEYDASLAWWQSFSNGYQDYGSKYYGTRVRAVRDF
jgi:uncharacterized repeat protein (TIGR02543 family)